MQAGRSLNRKRYFVTRSKEGPNIIGLADERGTQPLLSVLSKDVAVSAYRRMDLCGMRFRAGLPCTVEWQRHALFLKLGNAGRHNIGRGNALDVGASGWTLARSR